MDGIAMNGHSQYLPLAQSLQKANEVTPQQHSIKRKISSINWHSDSQTNKPRQLHRHMDRSADQTVMSTTEPTNSDQENSHMVSCYCFIIVIPAATLYVIVFWPFPIAVCGSSTLLWCSYCRSMSLAHQFLHTAVTEDLPLHLYHQQGLFNIPLLLNR